MRVFVCVPPPSISTGKHLFLFKATCVCVCVPLPQNKYLHEKQKACVCPSLKHNNYAINNVFVKGMRVFVCVCVKIIIFTNYARNNIFVKIMHVFVCVPPPSISTGEHIYHIFVQSNVCENNYAKKKYFC